MTSTNTAQVVDTGARKMSARDTIIAALDSLESENEQLKNFNNTIQDEMTQLERENQRLRNEIHQMKNERHTFKSRIQEMESTNDALQQEIQNQKLSVKENNKLLAELHEKLTSERSVFSKEAENLKNMLIQREEAVKRAEREADSLRMRVERATRKNYSDRDVELLHEVELLKAQKRELSVDNDELTKLNKKLKNELSNLQAAFDDKEAELKNEGRRHSILTKEFNSLLDENSRLKLQMRRKSNQPSVFASPSIEQLEELGSDVTHSTSRSLLPRQPMPREPSLIINNEPFQPTRDYTFTSRDKHSPSVASSRMPSMTSREPSLVRRGGSFSVRDGKKGGRPAAAKFDDRTTPDTLPSLNTHTNSAQTSKSK